MLGGTRFRGDGNSRFKGRACDIVGAIFFGVFAENHQLWEVAGRGFECTLPVVLGAVCLPLLREATRQIHMFHYRIERELLALDQPPDFVPAAERAEGIYMLKEQLPGLHGSLPRNRVELALIFTPGV